MARKDWSKKETIIAFNVYCKIPFSQGVKTNPTIIKYANIIGRTPSALAMKVGNIGRLDPELKKRGIGGLQHGARLEEEVWNEFHGNWDKLAFESEKLIAEFQKRPIEESTEIELTDLPEGKERESIIKTRVNQSFFRSAVLMAYDSKCCITGLTVPYFLEACHILSWNSSKENRTNPHNGLCLNGLHHKAFDNGLITITPDYKVLVSSYFNDFTNDKSVEKFFKIYNNQKINLPKKFLPSKEFLENHYKTKFKN